MSARVAFGIKRETAVELRLESVSLIECVFDAVPLMYASIFMRGHLDVSWLKLTLIAALGLS